MKVVAAILFVLLLILQAQLWFGSHGVFQLWSLQDNTSDIKQKNDDLSQRNEQLHAEVVELKEGKEALEEKARSQLGFIKDGEVFYRVVPESSEKAE